MKTATAAMQVHLAKPVTTLATCWKITRADGIVEGYTDHSADLPYDGVTYYSAKGFDASAITTSRDFATDSLQVEGVVVGLPEADLLGGVYDGAEVEIFAVNWMDLSPTMGRILLRKGTLGEVSVKGKGYVAEIRGLMDRLRATIGELYQENCRCREVGDARCKVNLAGSTPGGVAIRVNGSVTHPYGVGTGDVCRVFGDSARAEPDGHFDWGRITWLTGDNAGMVGEIRRYYAWVNPTYVYNIELQLALPHPIALGDTYQMVAGCDRTRATCRTKFANVVNFRGEPDLPGRDRLAHFGPS